MIKSQFEFTDFDSKLFAEHNLKIENFDVNKDGLINGNEADGLVSVFELKSIGEILTEEKLKNEIDTIEKNRKKDSILDIGQAAFCGVVLAEIPTKYLHKKIKKASFWLDIGMSLLGLAGGAYLGLRQLKDKKAYMQGLKEVYETRKTAPQQ